VLGEAQLARLLAALATVRHDPFDAQFTGLAYFLRDPHARSRTAQNVLWARPDHAADNQMRSLHYKISRALADNHLDYGIKDITPHLTVAKVPANDNRLIEAFAAAHDGQGVTAPWRCDRFGVYETLDRADPRHPANNGGRGTRYVRVAEFILRP
jgi:2'-5' RNA ligase